MLGSVINGVFILLAGLAVGLRLPEIPAATQRRIQVVLGVLTLGLGFHVVWRGINGSALPVLRQTLVVLSAWVLGKLSGQLLGLQRSLNGLGGYARERLTRRGAAQGDVFAAATVVFCLTPLAVVAPVQQALGDDGRGLLLKSVLDGLAAMAFIRSCGWGVALVALPVVALQGTLVLLFEALRGWVGAAQITDSIYATSGLLLVAVALVMLQVMRVRLADYLPSLLWAGLLAWGLL